MVKGVVRYTELRRRTWPYLVIWIIYYAWALVFVTVHTASPASTGVYTLRIRGLVHGFILLSAAIGISVYKKRRFVLTGRIGACVLVCALPVYLFLLPPSWRLYTAPFIGIVMGLVNVSILIPFVFILNNTEKFYAVVGANILLNGMALAYQVIPPAWIIGAGNAGIAPAGEKVLSVLLLVAAVMPVFRFKRAGLDAVETDLPKPRPAKITYFSLAINFV
ncbi:MAG: hypothetical protein LBQ55_11425, partial [Treponema sp.]|nr:hypothetical protein [Treponema sp.]